MNDPFDSESFLADKGKDAVNPVGYIYKGGEHNPPTHRWRSLIERYVGREFAFYCSFREGPATTVEHHVLLYWPRIALLKHLGLEVELARAKVHIEGAKNRACDMKRAVLIGVREFMEMPEGTLGALPCAAVRLGKRLLVADQIDSGLSDVSEMVIDPSLGKPSLELVDGELVFVAFGWRAACVEDHEFPYQLIHGRSEVMNDLANTDSPHRIRGLVGVDTDNQFANGLLELDTRSVRTIATERLELGIQSVELIPCSLSLQADA